MTEYKGIFFRFENNEWHNEGGVRVSVVSADNEHQILCTHEETNKVFIITRKYCETVIGVLMILSDTGNNQHYFWFGS